MGFVAGVEQFGGGGLGCLGLVVNPWVSVHGQKEQFVLLGDGVSAASPDQPVTPPMVTLQPHVGTGHCLLGAAARRSG